MTSGSSQPDVPAMVLPTAEYRKTTLVVPRKIPAGLDALVDGVVGMFRRRSGVLRRMRREAERIEGLAGDYSGMGDGRLREALAEFRTQFRRRPGCDSPDLLFPAVAALREASARRTGLRPYPVQIVGCLALHRGYLAEMATGEGKTLVAAMAAVLAAWTRRPCHVVTVNDYLAQRDAEWFRPLYSFCGLTAGFVLGQMESADRRANYTADITYTTGKEILADFLRDRLRLGLLQNPERRHIQAVLRRGPAGGDDGVVMRGLHTAIVDEADSILIDEAVTPLIISHPQPNDVLRDACRASHRVAADLAEGTDYRLDLRYREAELTEAGYRKVAEKGRELGGIWRARRRWVELVEQALTARHFFRMDQQYVKEEEKIVIVDEFTGRLMPQRTWRHGLHQAIEAKEGVEISEPSETLSRLSFQRFFRFFKRLSGMTGTAREAARECWRIYRLPVVSIPTNRPCIRRMGRDRIFSDSAAKWDAVVEEVLQLHGEGRPVLVGTRSVRASEELASRLRQAGCELNLLNAVYHREEARIVAEAGIAGKITIATNMAGRGTDIKLGRGVVELGGLHVLATERHESRRIDRQLFGRSARQGDPGSAQAFVSVEDDLLARFLPGDLGPQWLAMLISMHYPGARLIAGAAIRFAQRQAQRQAAKQREGVQKMDTWIDDSLSFALSPDRIG